MALGAYKASPIESLYTKVNEHPLSIRRQKFALQYYIKLASCPSNPAHNVLYCPQNKTFEKKKNPSNLLASEYRISSPKYKLIKHKYLNLPPQKPHPGYWNNQNITKSNKKKTHTLLSSMKNSFTLKISTLSIFVFIQMVPKMETKYHVLPSNIISRQQNNFLAALLSTVQKLKP